jgi:two-component system, NarL family, sensor histidine kinase UhpB
MENPRMTLFWRLFAVNAVILALIAILLIASPVTISAPIHLAEAAIVLAGLIVTLAANFVLLRRALAPLDRLAERMEIVDLLRPGQRLPARSGVVGRVIHSFNRMLDRLEAERQLTAQRALAAQEMERIGIARNLHDEVGQLLTGVLLQLDAIAEDVPAHGEEIGETKQVVRQALEEVRRISSELRPEMLEHLGLISALIELATSFQKRSGIRVDRTLDSDITGLSPETELAIYRIAQEALTNVSRHSQASSVSISLQQAAGRVVLRVVDDGLGLPDVAQEHGGLRSMRERAILLQGALAVKPASGGGVDVRLEVPTGAELLLEEN